MARFVLVHGAMHGGWCWERLARLLEDAGHDIAAPDLPGARNELPPADVTLEGYADAIIACLDADPRPAILVGHSLGGMAISCAAEARPDKVTQLVYLCALLPKDGESPMDVLALNPDRRVVESFEFQPDGLAYTLPEADRPRIFYSGCDAADVAAACARLVPQSVAPMAAPARLSATRYGRVPRRYIKTLRDEALAAPFQQAMIDRDPGIPVSVFDTGHSPFLSMASALRDDLCAHLPAAP